MDIAAAFGGEAGQPVAALWPAGRLAALQQLFDVGLVLDGFAALPAAVVGGNLLAAAQDAYRVIIGAKLDSAAHVLGRDRVGVGIELDAGILGYDTGKDDKIGVEWVLGQRMEPGLLHQKALCRALAVEWGPRNVRINCIAPGLVKTDFARALWEDPKNLAKREADTPLRRIGQPYEIGPVAAFLASSASSFMTGQVVVVDGGVTIA